MPFIQDTDAGCCCRCLLTAQYFRAAAFDTLLVTVCRYPPSPRRRFFFMATIRFHYLFWRR